MFCGSQETTKCDAALLGQITHTTSPQLPNKRSNLKFSSEFRTETRSYIRRKHHTFQEIKQLLYLRLSGTLHYLDEQIDSWTKNELLVVFAHRSL